MHWGLVKDAGDCGHWCAGTSTMFSVSPYDSNDKGYVCYCETSANDDATCTKQDSEDWRLYKYTHPYPINGVGMVGGGQYADNHGNGK